jgi:hypothetical protein
MPHHEEIVHHDHIIVVVLDPKEFVLLEEITARSDAGSRYGGANLHKKKLASLLRLDRMAIQSVWVLFFNLHQELSHTHRMVGCNTVVEHKGIPRLPSPTAA